MKKLDSIFADEPEVAVKRPGTPLQAKNITADHTEGRRWPTLEVQSNSAITLQKKIDEQSAELTLRCTQVADLCNIKLQQATELLNACDEIEQLCAIITQLQDIASIHETESVAAKQNLIQAEKEAITLRALLDKARRENADLLQRLLSVQTAFNDREVDIISTQEIFERQKATEKARLEAAIEVVAQRHRNEINRLREHFGNQIKRFEAIIVERDIQVRELERARATLADRCGELAKTMGVLESTQQHTQENFESQVGQVKVLEALLKIEREAAELKIKELAADLQRERLRRPSVGRSSVANHGNILQPSLRLATGQNQADGPKLTPMPHNNAA